MKNNLRKLRGEQNLTQAQLAEKAGLSQQQVQRVESGVHAVRIDVAAAIAAALEVNLGSVFPDLSISAPGLARRRNFDYPTLYSERNQLSLEESGFEADPDYWLVRIGLPGGAFQDYPINTRSKRRLEEVLTAYGRDGFASQRFFCFDSLNHTVCFRLAVVDWIQIRWERADVGAQMMNSRLASEEAKSTQLRAYLVGNNEPLEFTVEPDHAEDALSEERQDSPLTELVFSIDGQSPADACITFEDDDGGEQVYLNPFNVALIEIPLPVPEESDDELE